MFLKQIYRLFLVVFLVTVGMTGTGKATILDYSFDINFTVTGTNPYGFGLGGNSAHMAITIDTDNGFKSSPPDAPYSFHSFALDSSFSMDLTFGNTSFDETDDFRWGSTAQSYPTATFNTPDWSIDNISFFINDTSNNSLIAIEVQQPGYPITLTAGTPLSGQSEEFAEDGIWAEGKLPGDIGPIPEPATMTLFGLGLLGLAGMSRRSRQ